MLIQDSLQRFLFEHADIRGAIVHLNTSLQTIMQQHQYPEPIQHLLSEALVTSALLCATIKFEGHLTLQFQSNGVLRLLIASCDNNFDIRGLAQFDADKLEATDPEALLGEGTLVVTLQGDDNTQLYQSIIPLNNQGIAKSLEHYFAQSEQLSTRIWLAVNEDSAAGVLLQLLPEQSSRERENFWELAVKLGETLTDGELLQLDNITLLRRLYFDQDLRLFEPKAINFLCTCTKQRMENAIQLLGQEDAETLLQERHAIEVTCEFCSQHYLFDQIDVAAIFHGSL